ncbi:MAG: RNA polymerase sigma factor [Caldilineaceae bacterium]|nr:RNA polymerase sigma factor [Caldilineaceae bacterium]
MPADWRFEGNSSMSTAVMEMPELIQAARGGDDLAFTHLVNHYQAAAQRLAQQILRTEEAAADAVQDALIKVHRALPRFQDGNFRSWLLRIVTNTCYDYLRSQRRRSTVSLDELTDPSGAEFPQLRADEQQNPERLVTQQESLQYLLHSIEQLPNWHRDVVLLVDVHGYDYTEAAELLNLPLGTVKSRLSRARSALRDQLIDSGFVARQPSAPPQ